MSTYKEMMFDWIEDNERDPDYLLDFAVEQGLEGVGYDFVKTRPEEFYYFVMATKGHYEDYMSYLEKKFQALGEEENDRQYQVQKEGGL